MNQEVKKLWVDALRSGEYQQCTGTLKDTDGYCCLGVLCDIHRKVTNTGHWENSGLSWDLYECEDDEGKNHYGEDFLPLPVYTWAGLTDESPKVQLNPDDFGGQQDNLSYLNDEIGMTFKEIADLIEEQL